ncbi:MAG: SWIM zinc finger family protein [Bacteroidota bacterium]|nr:SWIM zinc finger family protein [Bacteroidota bacterium]MXW13698.1 hypothetical protein [Rhodothermaceae bacterium]MDE2644805.1 SWIM zinc finger family protein [Bacteroidota bacterium]MXW33104.1 hypothetical protein [Rhodothermaceae bacterium]MYC04749.1 hypothetical protein [Rhodothermaceae bacterium]
MPRYYDDYYFPPSRPRAVKGGIKAQSKRGRFGQTWWGCRWIDTLESYSIGARLGRGKSYARSGQVISIDIKEGEVRSAVQGSRGSPYSLAIHLRIYKPEYWERLAKSLREQPFYVARLLAGEIPGGFEAIMEEHGMPLFPQRRNDLLMKCSCPDWSNPCKHLAAVIYLLAEEFDRDPFLLFKLRGITREELLSEITGTMAETEKDADEEVETIQVSTPLTPDNHFWEEGPLPDDFYGVVRIPPVPAALPKRLGKFPFWRAEIRLSDVLESVYKKASLRGLRVFQGEE